VIHDNEYCVVSVRAIIVVVVDDDDCDTGDNIDDEPAALASDVVDTKRLSELVSDNTVNTGVSSLVVPVVSDDAMVDDKVSAVGGWFVVPMVVDNVAVVIDAIVLGVAALIVALVVGIVVNTDALRVVVEQESPFTSHWHSPPAPVPAAPEQPGAGISKQLPAHGYGCWQLECPTLPHKAMQPPDKDPEKFALNTGSSLVNALP
jgi:hypothetical protein